MQQPLAIAVIGGLITNMLLTRLLIPVGYLVLVGRRERPADREPPYRVERVGSMARMLIVEDQQKHRESLQRGLEAEGYEVVTASTGIEGFACGDDPGGRRRGARPDAPRPAWAGRAPRPPGSGFAKPVLILTALDAVEERVQGLDSGANDYLVKPFAFTELLARLRAAPAPRLRRARTVLARGRPADGPARPRSHPAPVLTSSLTGREYELLEYLLRNKNEAVTRDMIARDVWKETTGGDDPDHRRLHQRPPKEDRASGRAGN